MLVVAGSDEALAPIRGSFGPWIVTDLDETRQLLVEAGAEITREITSVPTGRMMYAHYRIHSSRRTRLAPCLAAWTCSHPLSMTMGPGLP